MKKMKVAMIVTIIVTLAYATCLLVVNIPEEKNLIIFGVNIAEIPFYVSPWWNLVLSPLVIIFIAYAYGQEQIIGKEPKSKEGMIQMKYETKIFSYLSKVVSIFVSLGTMVASSILLVVCAAFNLDIPDYNPISVLVSSVLVYLATYLVLGIGFHFIVTLFWNTSWDDEASDESLLDRFTNTFVCFAKTGLFKTLPSLLGMTIAFIFRIVFSLRISFNRNPISK